MLTIYDEHGKQAGTQQADGKVVATPSSSSGRKLSDWLTRGVTVPVGEQHGDVMTEEAQRIAPSDPWFNIALLDKFERAGWTVRDPAFGETHNVCRTPVADSFGFVPFVNNEVEYRWLEKGPILFSLNRQEAIDNACGGDVLELVIHRLILENRVLTANSLPADKVRALLLNADVDGMIRVWVPVRNDMTTWEEAKHSRDKGKFASHSGGAATVQGGGGDTWAGGGHAPELAGHPGLAPDAHAAAGEAHGVEEHDAVGEHGGGAGHDEHAGPGHHLEHTAHQAHVAHEAHEVAEVLGGGHSEAAAAVKGHFAEHGAEAAHGAHGAGDHAHSLADVGAIVASHTYGVATKAVQAILSKMGPVGQKVAGAIGRVADAVSATADHLVGKMKADLGDGTASAIMGASSLLHGGIVGGLTGGVAAKAMPAKGLILAIPFWGIAKAAKAAGLLGPGSKVEQAASRAGSWIQAIKEGTTQDQRAAAKGEEVAPDKKAGLVGGTVEKGAALAGKGIRAVGGAAAAVGDKAFKGGARLAGKAAGAIGRGIKRLTGNELEEWIRNNSWRQFDEDGLLINAGPAQLTQDQIEQYAQQLMTQLHATLDQHLDANKDDLLAGQGVIEPARKRRGRKHLHVF